MKKLITIPILTFLISCGGGSGSSNQTSQNNSTSTIEQNQPTPTLSPTPQANLEETINEELSLYKITEQTGFKTLDPTKTYGLVLDYTKYLNFDECNLNINRELIINGQSISLPAYTSETLLKTKIDGTTQYVLKMPEYLSYITNPNNLNTTLKCYTDNNEIIESKVFGKLN